MHENEIYENPHYPVETESEFQREAVPEIPPQYAPAYLNQTTPKKRKKNKTGTRFVAIALCFSLLGAAFGAGGAIAVDLEICTLGGLHGIAVVHTVDRFDGPGRCIGHGLTAEQTVAAAGGVLQSLPQSGIHQNVLLALLNVGCQSSSTPGHLRSKGGIDTNAQAIAAVKGDVDAFFKDADLTENAKDTLKEIQDYINSDASAASEMTSSIQQNAQAITAVEGRVGTAEGKITTLEGKAHEHANKALLDTYTQTEENLADAVAKLRGISEAQLYRGKTDEAAN